MSAPLYSRYCRYIDRDIKRFPRKAAIGQLIPMWKRPQTRIYSLSSRASHEAGWWSTEDPGELLRAISLQYLPAPYVWMEYDFRAHDLGSLRLPIDTQSKSLDIIRGDGEIPSRVAFMFFRTEAAIKLFPLKLAGSGEGGIMALTYYLYPSGGCFVGPPIVHWDTRGPLMRKGGDIAEPVDATGRTEADYALGTGYLDLHEGEHPRLMNKLKTRVGLTAIGSNLHTPWSEINGHTRSAISILTAALSARPPAYVHDLGRPSAPRREAEWGTKERPIEVDLFIRERARKPGASIRASVGHLEGIKKGLHMVGAHYAYRARADGGDPTICPVRPHRSLGHDFEDIAGTKSQVCVHCGQKRWFRDQHQRGDEAYGIVPQKVRNVRLGAQTRETTQ